MEFVHYRDVYEEKSGKVIALFQYGLWMTDANIIIKSDDDTIPNITNIVDFMSKEYETDPDRELYGGRYKFGGHEYKSMQGPNNTQAPFMSGITYFATRGAVHAMFRDDR